MGAFRGLVSSPMQLQKDYPPSSSFLSSLRGKSSFDMLQRLPQSTSLGDSSQGLPLSCQTAESSPHSPYLNQFESEGGSSDENIVPSIVEWFLINSNSPILKVSLCRTSWIPPAWNNLGKIRTSTFVLLPVDIF